MNVDSLCKSITQFLQDNPTGGNLHVILDDGNVDTRIIVEVISGSSLTSEEKLIISELLYLPEEIREELYAQDWRVG